MSINTQPLEKSFRTGEGILVYATNVVIAVAAVLPHGLNWTHAGAYLAVLNAVHVLSRSLLKASAIQQGIGIGAPEEFDPVDPAVIQNVVEEVTGQKPLISEAPAVTPTSGKLDSAKRPDGGDANADAAVQGRPAGE